MGLHSVVQQLKHQDPTLGANNELPRQRGKEVVPNHGWPIMGQPQLTSPLVESLVGGPSWQLWVSQPCLKSVACSGGPFDPCEAEWRALIG